MKKYSVTFVKYYEYEVEAKNPDEAIDVANRKSLGMKLTADDIVVERIEE